MVHHPHRANQTHHHISEPHSGSIALIIIVAIAVALALVYVHYGPYSLYKTAETDGTPAVSHPDIPSSEIIQMPPIVTQAHRVAETAVASSTIIIKDCIASPAVSKIPMNSTVTFVNTDARSHFISFSPEINIFVGANSGVRGTFTFWNTPGTRTFRCDTTEKAGTVFITSATQ
ncbi:MAG TPA: hypothetical protein VF438_00535 [Candidatus Paceibacterota bacterium]